MRLTGTSLGVRRLVRGQEARSSTLRYPTMRLYSYDNYCASAYGLYIIWDDDYGRVEMCNDLQKPGTLPLPLNWYFIDTKAHHG